MTQAWHFDWRGLVLPACAVVAWGIISEFHLSNPAVFVPLGRIAEAGGRLLGDGTLVDAIGGTLWKMVLGCLIGTSLGFVAGLALGLSRSAHQMAGPVVDGIRQVAIFAWVPLLTAWVGNGNVAILALVSLAAFLPIAVNVEAGCRAVPLPYLEVGRVLELDRLSTISQIVLPAARSSIIAGLELSLAAAWLSTIGAEYLIASGNGLGVLLASSRVDGNMDAVIVTIVALGIIGFGFHWGLGRLSQRTGSWRSE